MLPRCYHQCKMFSFLLSSLLMHFVMASFCFPYFQQRRNITIKHVKMFELAALGIHVIITENNRNSGSIQTCHIKTVNF